MKKSKSRYNLSQKISSVKLYLEETLVSALKKISISDEYEYSNIQIKWLSNIICICICAISGIRIYSDICLVNMLHPNIFGYSFGT